MRKYLSVVFPWLWGPGRVTRLIGKFDKTIQQLEDAASESMVAANELVDEIVELERAHATAMKAADRARTFKANLSKLLTA